jgi:hypothetical protein
MNIAIPHIRQTQYPNPAGLYNLFYKNIQEAQLHDKKYLDIFTNIIEKEVRSINVNTDDLTEKNIILEKTKLLMQLDRDVREHFINKHSEYLDALRKVLLFEGPEKL